MFTVHFDVTQQLNQQMHFISAFVGLIVDRLRLLENRVLRGIFGLKWQEMARGWRKLYNDELRNLYSVLN